MRFKLPLILFALLVFSCAAFAEVTVPVMENEFLLLEAENMIASSGSRVVNETGKASGGKNLRITGVDEVTGNPSLLAAFYVKNPSRYFVWIRLKSSKISTVLTYKLSSDEKFSDKTVDFDSKNVYTWVKLSRKEQQGIKDYSGGREEISLCSSETVNIDCIYISSNPSDAPTGSSLPPKGDENYKSPYYTDALTPVFPNPGEHPRLYVTKDDIPKIKEKFNSDFYKVEYQKITEKGNMSLNGLLPPGATDYTNYSSYGDILLSRAFLYLTGDADSRHALETVRELKSFLGTVTFGEYNSTYASRYMGDVMVFSACVYDWCYDVMTDSDRQYIIRKLKSFAKETEVGYPATKRSYVISHAAESLIYRDQLAVGIAVYDEDPGWYNATSSIVFSKLLAAKNFLSASHNDFSGNTYAQARNEGAMHTQRMVDALGYGKSVFNEEYQKLYYKFIYGRLPNGVWFKEGDDYAWDRYKPDTRSTLYGELFRFAGSRFNDPYILRQGLLDLGLNGSFYSVFDILSTDLNVGMAETTDLPMTHFTNYPMSSMTARTSWQNGLDAPTAMAYVNMREVTVGDHQHRDIGSFQLYYKGMLALDSGLYEYGDHYYNYQIRSVAHNVMLVEDPDETYDKYINDGGQRLPRNFGSIYDDLSTVEASVEKGECITANSVYSYSGPQTYKPDFSYISANIAPAYSNKVQDFLRSVVFVNLDNEDYPAALVVYDNIKSSDGSFKKKWLLHSEEEPSVTGNVTSFTRKDNGQNGKLTNITLLPENPEINLVGGEGQEFSVNSVNFPIKAPDGVQADMGNWRTEISPVGSKTEDLFLNVMYVCDADGNYEELTVNKGEGEAYVSATIMDKTIVFPKERQNISSAFEFVLNDNGKKTYNCLFTGISEGKWNISGNGINLILESVKDKHCITASLAPGKYTISPAETDAVVTPVEIKEAPKENFGDFLILKGNNLMYLPYPTKFLDGVPYVAIDGIFTGLGAALEECFENTVTFTLNNKKYTLTADSLDYTENGKIKTLNFVPFIYEGRLYASPLDFKAALGKTITYDDTLKLLTVR